MPVKFVVIDDDVSVRKIIRNIIEQNGLGTVVAECADGVAAERVISDTRPDIAVVDLLLPGQDGVELVKKLRSHSPSVSLIMVSQSSSQPMITQAYQHGIEFYIHKPINVLEIITVINKVKESRDLKDAMSVISRATAQYVSPSAAALPDGRVGVTGEPTPVRADALALGVALENLLRNAVEAVAAGRGSVAVVVAAEAARATVTIDDDGPGVPAEVRGRLFMPFATSKSSGGLGLALARRFARLHGGDVTYEPRAAGGSRFTLAVPLEEEP